MKQQKTETGWCESCRKMTKFIEHADLNYWICTTKGCWNREKELKEEPENKIYI